MTEHSNETNQHAAKTSIWHTLPAKEVMSRLDTDSEQGLTASEAAKRLAESGPNELKPPPKTPVWKTFLMQFNDFMIWVLLVAVAISFFEGQIPEGIAIIFVLLVNATLGTYQEYRAEQALEALKQMSAPTAMVIRDGEPVSIEARDLVPGDIVLLESGNKIPADGRLIEVGAMRAEEAALTGESKPSKKKVDFIAEQDSALGDRENMVFSGTSVSVGRGTFVVTDTGEDTQMGHIARLIAEQEEDMTPLQVELDRVGKRISALVLVIAVIVFAVDIYQFMQGGGSFSDAISESLLVAISLAVAAIPEGLPAVVTIALSLGVTEMAKRNAIVKKLHAVETLGSTSFICSDKTGTLTQNVMTVREILVGTKAATIANDVITPEEGAIRKDDETLLFDIALSANDSRYGAEGELIGDPTETALLVAASAGHPELTPRVRIGEVPFDSDRKRMSIMHENENGSREIYTKGGVDVVLALCTKALIDGEAVPLTQDLKAQILKRNETFASSGNRTLGFAYRELAQDEDLEDESIERNLIYVGIMAMLDPPRPEVTQSIAECHSAGINVAMVTGDHALTAQAIGREVGLPAEGTVVTGVELERMDDEALFDIVNDTHIYARVNPEHKIRIVSALKKHGHIVAMTGDGVNDAPALKKADIGVAMGKVGTDVSREAADMVLADDNFATIVKAVEQGRIVFDNLRKSILFLLSCNMSEVLIVFITALLPIATLLPASEAAGLTGPALLALQLLWINLVTDSLPALALGVDPGSDRVMKRKPRDANESIINRNTLVTVVLQGAFITAGALIMYYGSALGWFGPTDPHHSQTMLLTVVVLSQLLHAFSFRSSTKSIFSTETFKNKWLLAAAIGSLALHALVIYVPFLQEVFHTAPLDFRDWIEVLLAALIPLILNDLFKLLTRKKEA